MANSPNQKYIYCIILSDSKWLKIPLILLEMKFAPYMGHMKLLGVKTWPRAILDRSTETRLFIIFTNTTGVWKWGLNLIVSILKSVRILKIQPYPLPICVKYNLLLRHGAPFRSLRTPRDRPKFITFERHIGSWWNFRKKIFLENFFLKPSAGQQEAKLQKLRALPEQYAYSLSDER